ncbi:MAG: SDR family NAD(P)-dependent oxidoreductase [Caulobacter sp.]|nr:SDR family NAD(P)-dependent oxidoreductase [Caulobacter sp.]
MKIAGRVAVVTGGASGIGLGLATALARRGAKVLIADIEADRAAQAAAGLVEEGLIAASARLDVIDEASWQALADTAWSQWDEPPSLLFNNAGVGAGTTVHETPTHVWDWVFSVNIRGVYLGVKTFAQRMMDSGLTGRIINTGSEHALGLPPSKRGGITAPYTAAKHAVMGYSLCMRRDFEGTKLSAAIICPGVVQSDIWNSFRNRQVAFGGPRPRTVEGPSPMAHGLPAAVAGERIADQVESDEFFIFTNGSDEAEVLDTFTVETSAAMAAFRDRYGV